MMRTMVIHCILVVCLLPSFGCAILWPSRGVAWSENLALVRNGGECSVSEMCDGKRDTFGIIGVAGAATRTGKIGQVGVFDKEFHTSGQVLLSFLKMQPIDRIVIHSEELGYYKIFYRDSHREWREMVSDRHDGQSPIIIDRHIEASALVLDATPAAHNTRGRRKGRHPRPGQAQLRMNSAAKVYEIEVYARVDRRTPR